MTENKVITQVGQVWTNSEGFDRVATGFDGNYVEWNDGSCTDIEYVHDYFTFKPSNDLEWLAVNAIDVESGLWYRKTERNTVGIYASCGFEDYYAGNQVIDKRNELFGAKKMKVEYVEVDVDEVEFWEVAKEHGEGASFYYVFDGGYSPVSSITVLASQYNNKKLYRRVDSEETWQDEVKDFLGESYETASVSWMIENNPTSFIAICNMVNKMTDKPEQA